MGMGGWLRLTLTLLYNVETNTITLVNMNTIS